MLCYFNSSRAKGRCLPCLVAPLIKVHLAASIAAILIVGSFLVSTVLVEAFGSEAAIRSAKEWIVRGLFVLVPVMAAAGLTGRGLAGPSRAPVVRRKQRRLQVIAATGAFVLVPCAIALDRLAAGDDFGLAFGLVQALELAAGAFNLTLLGMNFRDGLWFRRRAGKRNRLADPAPAAAR